MTACYNFTTLKPLHLSKDDRELILDTLRVVRRMAYGFNFPHSTEDIDKVISQVSN